MIRFGILGSQGRMGSLVLQLLRSEFASVAQIRSTVTRGDSYESLFETDVIIDFSTPQVVDEFARQVLRKETNQKLPALIVGSTGQTPEQHETLSRLAQKTPVLVSSNFSIGIFLLSEALKQLSPILSRLKFTPVLIETHHRHKKDKPSGTALSLQKAITPSVPQEIQTHSIRAGEVIGEHEVNFYGLSEKLTFSHSAQDRSLFARGAIEGALWLVKARLQRNPPLPEKILDMTDYFHAMKE